MTDPRELEAFSIDELRAELAARERPSRSFPTPPSSEALAAYDSATIVGVLRAKQKVIYGVDNRLDLFEVEDEQILEDAATVVALFQADNIMDEGDGSSSLQTEPFSSAFNLCLNEPFRNQPLGAFCSGFLVAPDIVATAGHCLTASNLRNIRFVFGFRMEDETTPVLRIPNEDIYSGTELLGRVLQNNGADWALVRLERPVQDRPVARVRLTGRVEEGQELHVIGHPSGLPIKYAAGAVVRDNQPSSFFIANLDTYGGNSGSPVFNSDTHEVEGILVRGENDFVRQGTCTVSLVCPDTGCRGEDVTRTTQFAEVLAAHTQETQG